jgi:hypothetical protein
LTVPVRRGRRSANLPLLSFIKEEEVLFRCKRLTPASVDEENDQRVCHQPSAVATTERKEEEEQEQLTGSIAITRDEATSLHRHF